MWSKITLLVLSMMLVACSSKSKILKEIDVPAPHDGHLFKMSKYIVEVEDSSSKRFKFYFYDKDMRPISLEKVDIKKGVLDPDYTKANYGIDFIRQKTYIEGILHATYSENKAYEIDLEVKIDGEKRLITIPLNQNDE